MYLCSIFDAGAAVRSFACFTDRAGRKREQFAASLADNLLFRKNAEFFGGIL